MSFEDLEKISGGITDAAWEYREKLYTKYGIPHGSPDSPKLLAKVSTQEEKDHFNYLQNL